MYIVSNFGRTNPIFSSHSSDLGRESMINADPVASCVREIVARRKSWIGAAAELLSLGAGVRVIGFRGAAGQEIHTRRRYRVARCRSRTCLRSICCCARKWPPTCLQPRHGCFVHRLARLPNTRRVGAAMNLGWVRFGNCSRTKSRLMTPAVPRSYTRERQPVWPEYLGTPRPTTSASARKCISPAATAT